MNSESSGAPVRPVLIALFIGLLLGAAAAIVLPRYLGPRLPARFRPGQRVEGIVVDKTLDGDRLLLKVRAGDQMFLSTFFERWKEVDFLVERNDMVTLVVSGGDPFLENPPIEKVRRTDHSTAPAGLEPSHGAETPMSNDVSPEPSPAAADTVQESQMENEPPGGHGG